MSMLTDDDLGARLRAALQEQSPLATDPVPPARFVREVEVGRSGIATDLLDLHDVRARPRSGRRRAAIGGTAVVLAAAAAVVVGLVVGGLRSDHLAGPAVGPSGSTSPSYVQVPDPTYLPTTPGSPSTASTVAADPHATVPDRGGAVLGVETDVPYRCTAPAGTMLSADIDRSQTTPTVWRIGPGITCAPSAHPADTITFSADGMTAYHGGTADGGSAEGPFCTYVATGMLGVPLSFPSHGSSDFIEFYGEGCRLVLPAR